MDSLRTQAAVPEVAGLRTMYWLRTAIVAASGLLFALHFLHLTADFPHGTPWMDWSKYTDEGWYSDAAVRHLLSGHWYLQGDFNPGVALPVWPLLEAALFCVTGVSLAAARALTVVIFGAMLVAVWKLITRHEVAPGQSLAAPLAVLLLCLSPFFYAFERLAILEPLLATLAVLAMLAASSLQPRSQGQAPGRAWKAVWPALALGLLLPAMVLTKPTAIALLPAIGYLVWSRAGYRVLPAWRLAWPPGLLGLLIWLGYYGLFVRPYYLEDYQYLFAANAYTGFQLEPLARVLFYTVADGSWIGPVLYVTFFVLIVLLLLLRPRFFRNPLVPAWLLWLGGYFAFLAYHNNLQARYYLLLAVPVTALTAMAFEELRRASFQLSSKMGRAAGVTAVAVCVLAITIPDGVQEIGFVRHPAYTYVQAAQALARVVRANPSRSTLILSVSGSDLTLMNGLPSINTEFGTLDLDQRVRKYRPGWYVAWNELEDDDMKAMAPLYHPVPVASFPAMDDPDRNLLILYRLDPATDPAPPGRPHRVVPRALQTRLGQQPTVRQLQH